MTTTAHRPPRRRAGFLAAGALAAIGAIFLTGPAGGARVPAEGTSPALPQLIGQRLVVRMTGTHPDRLLLDRIGRGQVGGVILFSGNITGPAQVRSLTAELQRAARLGGRP
ncbi:MAG: hypothetical protein ACXVY5_07560, partial [Gaiellales bacterium]